MDRESEVVWFKEPLYVKTTISSDHLKELKEITHKILDNSDTSKNVNDTLAGNIEKELSFGEGLDESKKILEPYARSLADSYLEIVKNYNLYKNLSKFNKQHLDDDLEFVYTFGS